MPHKFILGNLEFQNKGAFMGDRFVVKVNKNYEVVQPRGKGMKGYFDVLKRTCAVNRVYDLGNSEERDGSVDAVQCKDGKFIVKDEKMKDQLNAYLARPRVSLYEEILKKDELDLAQGWFNNGMTLAKKRFGEVEEAFKGGHVKLKTERDDDGDITGYSIDYRVETKFEVKGIQRVGRQRPKPKEFCERIKGGLSITAFQSTDRDLRLRVEDPNYVDLIRSELNKTFNDKCKLEEEL